MVTGDGVQNTSSAPLSNAVGGVWAQLDEGVAEATRSPGVWHTLRDAAARSVPHDTTSTGVFAELRQRADPGQYCPQALPNIPEESISEDGQPRTIIHSPIGQYLALSPVEYAVWHGMDGTRTIGALAMIALTRFHKIFDATLVQSLRDNGFLHDSPTHLYRQLVAAVEQRTAEGMGRRLLRLVWGRTFAINGIDRVYGALYQAVGWLCFTPIALVLIALVAISGLGAYLLVPATFVQQVITTQQGGLTRSVLALYGALLVSFVLHESAHALAVKHYKRTVLRGGVMLYFGLPAAFIDTSDMWRSQRWPRIVVSAAGPVSDLFVGGVAALVAFAAPEWALSGAAYRLATMCYVATLFNLNPLLELDGYHILVDQLRLPRLRPAALAFVRGPLWRHLRERLPFSRNERIFTLYGLLAAGYSVIAIAAAALFWQRLLGRLFVDLWQGGLVGRVAAVGLLLGVVAPLAVGLLLVSWGVIRAVAVYFHRHSYGQRPALLAVVWVAFLAVLAAWGVNLAPLLAAACWTLGLAALGALVPDYAGARLLPALYALAFAAALGIGSALGGWLVPDSALWVRVGSDGLSLLLLMLAAFIALLDVELRAARTDELVWTALLLALAFVAGAEALYRVQQAMPTSGFGVHLLVATPAYFGALALALLLPYLMGLRGSRLVWGWLLVWSGVGLQLASYTLAIEPNAHGTGLVSVATLRALDILAAGLCAGGWLIQLATLRLIAMSERVWAEQPAISESQRLQRALRMCYAGCYRHLRAVYGRRRAQALDDRMDVLAATASWDVTLDQDRVKIAEGLANAPLDIQGSRYAEVLRYTVAIIEDLAGASFARRAIRAAYDALPWPEREAAGRRCFPDTPWAAELSSAFGSAYDARLRLLRQVDLFAACDDAELAALVTVVQTQHVWAGQQMLAIGNTPAGVWIIEAGEIGVKNNDQQQIEELRRGDHFGADALHVHTVDHSYRATIDSDLLFIPLLDLRTHLASSRAQITEGARTHDALTLLERVPLFADLPRHALRALAHVARWDERPARSVVVRAGVPSGMLYLLAQGEVAVVARSTAADGSLAVVARLGVEEFFGELELLHGTPPVASVVTLTPVRLLVVPHDALASLLTGGGSIARGLTQIGTGRLIDLRQRLEQ